MIRIACILLYLLPFAGFGQEKESWIQKPKEQWPQIALVNDVTYKNGDKYLDPSVSYAATGFLLNTGKDTLAVTVKHILWIARNKASNKVYINNELKSWKMHPKHHPENPVIIDRLMNEDSTEKLFDGSDNGVLQRDWLVLSTRHVPPGIQPVRISETPANTGDKVYLIGNPYRFEQTLVASGFISKKEGSILHVKFDDPAIKTAFLGGASGSPILNANGRLIGIFSNSRLDIKTGERIAIINSTAYLKKVLNGTKPLNVNKRPVSVYLDSLIQTIGIKKAMPTFEKFVTTQKAYNNFELTYVNFNTLIKTGETLATSSKEESVFYFEKLLNVYPDNHLIIIALARAYTNSQKKQKAVYLLESTKDKVDPDVNEELEKMLKDLKAG